MNSLVELRGGPWRAGWALDHHTISSEYRENGGFETERSETGELLYQLKYRSDSSKIEPLAEKAAEFLKTRFVFPYLAAIVPVPPSVERNFQPVPELAVSIGHKVNLPVALEYLTKIKKTSPLKDLEHRKNRKKELAGAFQVKDLSYADKYVLVFDDLFRSGETVQEITRTLMNQGNVARVFVLTLTKTRKRK